MLNKLFIAPIKGYQYISQMLPANCRYYPTCSEYAKWQFEKNSPIKAFYYTCIRILTCNQLFIGGTDYPVVSTPKAGFKGKITIVYWYVPKTSTKSYLIKNF